MKLLEGNRITRDFTADDLKDRLLQIIADHLGFYEGEGDTLEFAKSLCGQISRGYAYFDADRRFWGDII